MVTTVSRSSLATTTIWRLPFFAGVGVRLPAFADSSISMTLEMAPDAAALSERRVDGSHD
jgi:hypothetical protein